jgi:hypothetical protein
MRKLENTPTQKHLAFDTDEVWTRLPAAVQENCQKLCSQLLADVLTRTERSDDDGQN